MTAVETKERPILFSGPMIRAIREGRKSVTRRVMKPQPCESYSQDYGADGQPTKRRSYGYTWEPRCDGAFFNIAHTPILDACPHGRIGGRLWVRETWAYYPDEHHVIYREREGAELKAGGIDLSGCWKPSIHMPRWASRITLEITGIRVARVQEISEADVEAEGLEFVDGETGPGPGYKWRGRGYWDGFSTHSQAGGKTYHAPGRDGLCCCYAGQAARLTPAVCAYRHLWDHLNAKRGFSWEANPFVWCISFKDVSDDLLGMPRHGRDEG
jgi:hypothetical protein